MLRLSSEVEIKGEKTWVFHELAGCTIVEDVATLTDTCELLLPKKVNWQGSVDNKLPIKRGDKITVKLGYDDNLKTRFVGFIRTIDSKNPVKIVCEDGMFLLKTTATKKKGYKNTTLKQVITDLLVGTGIQIQLVDDDIELRQYRILKDTVAEELNEMKSTYGLRAYFRTINDVSKLYVGLGYPFDNRRNESFIYGKNLISEDFVYRVSEDVKIKVKAISIDSKNKRFELEVGDKDGEVYTVFHDNLTPDGLRLFAESELKRFKTTGFKGSLETFGEPFVSKCDITRVEASDNNKGNFLNKKVETSSGMNGFRQKIEIGQPLKLD